MGYETAYSLTIKSKKHSIEEIMVVLKEDCEYADYALDYKGECQEDCKWYDHRDDMIKFSKKYPDVLFTLSGVGESHDDQWSFFVKNGKAYKEYVKFIYPEYDAKLLKDEYGDD